MPMISCWLSATFCKKWEHRRWTHLIWSHPVSDDMSDDSWQCRILMHVLIDFQDWFLCGFWWSRAGRALPSLSKRISKRECPKFWWTGATLWVNWLTVHHQLLNSIRRGTICDKQHALKDRVGHEAWCDTFSSGSEGDARMVKGGFYWMVSGDIFGSP